jgi:hypothetical protein
MGGDFTSALATALGVHPQRPTLSIDAAPDRKIPSEAVVKFQVRDRSFARAALFSASTRKARFFANLHF